MCGLVSQAIPPTNLLTHHSAQVQASKPFKSWTAYVFNMGLSEQKPDMFAHKLKFILLPQLIATLSNYACSLPLLANVN